MRILFWVFLAALLAFLAMVIYFRSAAVDPDAWHVQPPVAEAGDYTSPNTFAAVREGVPEDSLVRLEAVALASARTVRLAGGAEQGLVTFISRSAVFGFPDFTTATIEDGKLTVWGRAKFGDGDLGVNQTRILEWLEAIGER